MSWENLPQETFIAIWDKCDLGEQESLSRVSKTWFSFVANRLRSPDGPSAKWTTDYLPENGLSTRRISDDIELVRGYFHLCELHVNLCYLMDKVIDTGHGLEAIFKLVGLTRFDHAVAVLLGLQNRFSPDMGKLYGSDMKGRIVYYEDEYYAHLKSRMAHIGRPYIASQLLEGLRYKKLFELLVETSECTGPVDIDKLVLRFSLVDPDYFQLMMCRRRVLDRVAKIYADTVNDSTPIETKILNVSSYLQKCSTQESRVVNGIVFYTKKRGLLSRYYGGDIATPPLFVFTCALCEALKICGFRCYVLDWEHLLVSDGKKTYNCLVGEELVIREVSLDQDRTMRSDVSSQSNGYNNDDGKDKERLLQLLSEQLGLQTNSEALKMVHDSIAAVPDCKPRDDVNDNAGDCLDALTGTETETLGGRRVIFPRAHPFGNYNLCARSSVEEYDFRAPLTFIEHLMAILTDGQDVDQVERSISLNLDTKHSAKAMIVRGDHPGLRFLKDKYRIGLTRPYSDLFFREVTSLGGEGEYYDGVKDGVVFSGGEVLLHTSNSRFLETTCLLRETGEELSTLSPTTDEKILIASAEPDSWEGPDCLGEFFSHFDWKEKRWIPNKLFQINCEEYDNGVNSQLDMLVSDSDWEPMDSEDEGELPAEEESPVHYRSYGMSSRLDAESSE